MTKNELLGELDRIEHFATQSRLQRLLSTPRKYVYGLLYQKLFYNLHSIGKLVHAETFFGSRIQLRLPSAMDIYLCGGKTHASEIRLSRFLVHHLYEDDTFLDIGAHIGFFSLLASHIAEKGQVVSVEASPQTYALLESNVFESSNIKAVSAAISDQDGEIEFLEFPVLYSEYNTLEKEQCKEESWFKKVVPRTVNIEGMKGAGLIEKFNLNPAMIKIDVEGAEEKVILGLLDFLKSNIVYVIMEFTNRRRGHANHLKAEEHLRSVGYVPYQINKDGELENMLCSTDDYIAATGLESDNIVYLREN